MVSVLCVQKLTQTPLLELRTVFTIKFAASWWVFFRQYFWWLRCMFNSWQKLRGNISSLIVLEDAVLVTAIFAISILPYEPNAMLPKITWLVAFSHLRFMV